MKKDALLKYCEEKKIWIPKGVGLDFIMASIAREALNKQGLARKSCFGLWSEEDNNCLSCDYSEACFEASLGMKKERYFKKIENADKIRSKD